MKACAPAVCFFVNCFVSCIVYPPHIKGKFEDADLLYMKAIAIGDEALGPDHPSVAEWLNNRAAVLMEQVRAVRR